MKILLLSVALALGVSAQETLIRQVYDPVTDTHVEVLALFTKASPGGYFPLRVKIANNTKSDRRVSLDFESLAGYGSEIRTRSSFDLSATAGKAVTRDILVPLPPPGGSNPILKTNLTGQLGEGSHHLQSGTDPAQPAVLLSEALFTPNASTLDSEIATKFSSSYGGKSEFAGKFDPKQVPDDWLAFSGYDSVVMTDDDWSDIPPGGKNAILSWVRLGGQLLVYTSGSATAAALGLPEDAGFGSIAMPAKSLAPTLDAAELVREVTDNKTKPRQVSIRDDFQGGWPLQKHFGGKTFRYGLFVFVLVIFAIVVGPINLFVFAKSGSRHKLFITTPLISLAASLILIVIIIVQDGFGGDGMRRVLMEVRPDAGVNAAYVHQEQFSRTGVLTAADFTLATPAIFSPVPIMKSRWARFTDGAGAQGNFNLQPEGGQFSVAGDWWQSRSEHGHILSAVISTRGRIETTDAPNTFLSTFEHPIDTLFYLDAEGQWHRADGITAGKRFKLAAVDPTMALPALAREAMTFGNRNRQFMETAVKRRGHFVALATRAPGIATHPGIRWQETLTVITGPIVAP